MKKNFYKKIGILMFTLSLSMSQTAAVQAARAVPPVPICHKTEWEVLKIVNQERESKDLEPLSVIENLQNANNVRSAELSAQFSHTRPNGSDYTTALLDTKYNAIGENIAVGYRTPKEVMEGWMHSRIHKANILSNQFTHIGVGYYYNENGTYQYYWSQMFIGSCNPTSISVEKSRKIKSYKRETSIEEMNRVLKVKCTHGTSFVPLTAKMCGGYDADTTGLKKITVKYRGKSTSFKVNINGINIRKAKISNIKNKIYNGKLQTQEPTVTLNGKTLIKDRDYTISYKNNRKKGKASMIITGKGIYSGTVTKSFRIKK